MGRNIDLLKGEFTKTPEQLKPEKLKTAQGLAGVLTRLRKFLYLFFDVSVVITLIVISTLYVSALITTLIICLGFFYVLFKIRDYIRGTI